MRIIATSSNSKIKLISKRNILIVWFFIHGLAFYVNLFDIDGEYKFSDRRFEYGRERVYIKTIKVFGGGTGYSNDDFWPFTTYTDRYMTSESPYKVGGDNVPEIHFEFNGLFLQYDLSEFVAYTFLIFIFLYFYFLWGKKKVFNYIVYPLAYISLLSVLKINLRQDFEVVFYLILCFIAAHFWYLYISSRDEAT